jgi:hypothetical protein
MRLPVGERGDGEPRLRSSGLRFAAIRAMVHGVAHQVRSGSAGLLPVAIFHDALPRLEGTPRWPVSPDHPVLSLSVGRPISA